MSEKHLAGIRQLMGFLGDVKDSQLFESLLGMLRHPGATVLGNEPERLRGSRVNPDEIVTDRSHVLTDEVRAAISRVFSERSMVDGGWSEVTSHLPINEALPISKRLDLTLPRNWQEGDPLPGQQMVSHVMDTGNENWTGVIDRTSVHTRANSDEVREQRRGRGYLRVDYTVHKVEYVAPRADKELTNDEKKARGYCMMLSDFMHEEEYLEGRMQWYRGTFHNNSA